MNSCVSLIWVRSRAKHAGRRWQDSRGGGELVWWHSISSVIGYHLGWSAGPVTEAIHWIWMCRINHGVPDTWQLTLHSKYQSLDVQSGEWCLTTRDSRCQVTMWLQLEGYVYTRDITLQSLGKTGSRQWALTLRGTLRADRDTGKTARKARFSVGHGPWG